MGLRDSVRPRTISFAALSTGSLFIQSESARVERYWNTWGAFKGENWFISLLRSIKRIFKSQSSLRAAIFSTG